MWFTSPSTPIQGVGVDKDCTSQFVMTNTIKYCTTLHYTAQSLQFVDSHDLVANKPQQSCQDAQVLHLWPRVWMFGFTRGARFCTQMDGVLWVFTVVQQSDKMWQDVTSASTCFGCTGCINLVDLSVLSRQSLRPSVSTFWTMPWTRASVLTCLTKARILLPFWIFWSLFSSLFIPFLYFSLFLSISLYFSQFLANELFPTPFF